MGKYVILPVTANCTGCRRCQLGCSFAYTKTFNPVAANIHVDVSDTTCTVTFTEDCRKCGICADQFFYDALIKTRKEAGK